MSDAKSSSQDGFSINVCSQCVQPFSRSSASHVRHATPCGHVACKDCQDKIEDEQKSGRSLCRRPGCGKKLGPIDEFVIAWCVRRTERIKTELEVLLEDQGNAGEIAAPAPRPNADAVSSLCTEHKLPFQVVEVPNHRPLCVECVIGAGGNVPVQTIDEAIAALEAANAKTSAELARQKDKLAELTFTRDELCDQIAQWGALETARVKAWEEREVKHVQAVAMETLRHVQEVCARRMEVGASLITQRIGLRASLDELDHALSDLPTDTASRLGALRSIYCERKRLGELLVGKKIPVPSAWAVLEWAKLPSLSAEFGENGVGSGGVLANATSAAANAKLAQALGRIPVVPLKESSQAFPVIPKLDATKGLRLIRIPIANSPSVFVSLDDDNVAVAFSDMSPVQVWDLAAGKLVRLFEGKGQWCYSMVNLQDERIAVGWYTGTCVAVDVIATSTGKLLQQLTGFSGYIYGLALVDDHLLIVCDDKTLRVWSQDAAGKFAETAKFATTGRPRGKMTVLSSSTVAISSCLNDSDLKGQKAPIEIWDWREGKQVSTLPCRCFGHWCSCFAHTLLPDGRFVTCDMGGVISIGSLDNWAAAVVLNNNHAIYGVLAGQDGSFVTADTEGYVKLWSRESADRSVLDPRTWFRRSAEVTLKGRGRSQYYSGMPLGIVGRRLVVVGSDGLLVTPD